MSSTLGKRKRRVVQETEKHVSQRPGLDELEAQEKLRRFFEAKFAPLPEIKKPVKAAEDSEDEESDFSGFESNSDNEEDVVQVVEHSNAQSNMVLMSKEERKAFMSSKPPTNGPDSMSFREKLTTKTDDDGTEADNIKNDLALKRLLAESHLLESSANPTLSGTNRHKATDLRLQALGSKTSILKQEKMPMTHRKGIVAKQTMKEDIRRREARENGIILERAKLDPKKIRSGKRDRGVGAPGVGKFSGGTLKLSKQDIFEIEGPKRSSSGRGGRGGRGGSRGRGKRGR